MDKIIVSPGKYIQGANALANIGKYVKPLAGSVLVIADNFVAGLVGSTIQQSFEQADVQLTMAEFAGECCHAEIELLVAKAKELSVQAIVGIGGGKTLDTAKAVAHYAKLPVVVAPTIASTDAPTSALSVVYTSAGEFSEYLFLPCNPNMVIMDTAIIASAPTRLLVAGMGDALSTYFEARANIRSGKTTMAGGAPTRSAQALAKLCYDTLIADGLKAKISCDQNLSSAALENIVEANTYLSGIGFESSGLAAAHAIHNGLTKMEECHHLYHGEKVAFGTLTQLLLENAPMQEITTVIDFCNAVGLPTNFKKMGITEIDRDKLMEVAQASCAAGETIHNMPFEVTPEAVLCAMLTADQLGS